MDTPLPPGRTLCPLGWHLVRWVLVEKSLRETLEPEERAEQPLSYRVALLLAAADQQ